MPPSHLKAMRAIEECRTETLGGQVYFCKECKEHHYSYHSCKNRHCPKCQNDKAEEWLQSQNDLRLPVTYFMVTFTLPDCLRQLTRSNQEIIYNILFRTSAAALQKLALDPKYVGGKPGFLGVLQTWTRDLMYHPHIHYIVPGGGLSEDSKQWMPAGENFFLPVKALSIIFRAKFRDELKKTELFDVVPPDTWRKDWVVHCEGVGSGEHAFEYLAPYIFRVAISNNRILKLKDGMVTFQYKESATDKLKTKTVPAEEFIRRFLQHVLPHRFIKVRYYGFLSSGNRDLLKKVKELLGPRATEEQKESDSKAETETRTIHCPKCGHAMVLIKKLPPKRRGPP